MNTQEAAQATITVVKDFFAEYTEEQLALAEYIDNLGIYGVCGMDYLDDLDCEDITTVEDFEDHFYGHYTSEADFAEGIAEECDDMRNVPAHIANHIDWQAVWDCELHLDFRNVGGLFFHT